MSDGRGGGKGDEKVMGDSTKGPPLERPCGQKPRWPPQVCPNSRCAQATTPGLERQMGTESVFTDGPDSIPSE